MHLIPGIWPFKRRKIQDEQDSWSLVQADSIVFERVICVSATLGCILAGAGGSRLLVICLSLGEGHSAGEGILKALLRPRGKRVYFQKEVERPPHDAHSAKCERPSQVSIAVLCK